MRRVKNIANDRLTRVLFYDQTLKKGYASLASFSKLFVLRRMLVTLVAYPLSLVCWVFLVVLNRFTPVRIYRFKRPNRPDKASHYIAQMEPFCRELQVETQKTFIVMIDAGAIVNLELLKLYASHFDLYLDDRSKFARTLFSLIPKFGFTNTFVYYSHFDTNWELAPARNLKITEPTKIPEVLSALGLKPLNFVLIAFPSITYYLARTPEIVTSHNRFINPSTSADALKLLIREGLKIVRMGVDTDELPDSLKDLPIIDLSGKFRTDSQDLWLFEHCFFNWSMGSIGTWHFAHKFDRPTLITDSYALNIGYRSTMFMMKTIHSSLENRSLAFKELWQLRGVHDRVSEMKARDLTYVVNSPSELVSSVAEMLDYINNKLEYTDNDLSLFSQYSEALIQAGYPPMLKNYSRPCISFLRDHHDKTL